MFIPVPPYLPVTGHGWSAAGLAAPSLSEGSVNLDAALQRSVDSADCPESFCSG
jgi:hypothetical protein